MFYQLHFKQKIHSSIEEVWDFISSPSNLQHITPKSMLFKITSDKTSTNIYPGMIITYKVSPLLGIQMDWMTEITQIDTRKMFIDEQRYGPYKLWHHQHILEKAGDHVIMKDIISYIPPFGILGTLANYLFIKKKIKSIFKYREQALDKVFH